LNLPNIIVNTHQDHSPARQIPSQEVPPRVQVAFRFLETLTEKTATKPLPTKAFDGDGGITYEALQGQELTVEEREAMTSALKLLTSYFKGEMGESHLETDARRREEERRKDEFTFGLPIVIDCPQCGGNPRRGCFVCRGKGRISAGLAP
jgi:hypothetical protein